MFTRILLFTIVTSGLLCHAKKWADEEETEEYWNKLADDEIEIALKRQKLNSNKAKNVVLFIGDGMDITTITSARILKGQRLGLSGENTKLNMDMLPNVGLSKTYSVDRQVADSASTATAILSGIKTRDYMLGVNGKTIFDDCASQKGNEINSTMIEAWEAGKSIGIVTTTRIMHATPASAYGHAASRSWYSDADLSEDAIQSGCKDLAQQLIDKSHMFTVLLGGGRAYMRPNGSTDEEYDGDVNRRLDGQDLIDTWKKGGEGREYVWNKSEFDMVDVENTEQLLGLFQPKDMQYEADRGADPEGEPSIAEMVEVAINMLKKNEKGFYLLVEGGRIDHAHHDGNAFRALTDAVAFDDAIGKAKGMTSEDDSLIIVTADHGHTVTLGGYAHRGNPIFGLTQEGPSYVVPPVDNKRYTSILYANGPGFQGIGTHQVLKDAADPSNVVFTRQNIKDVNTEDKDYLQQTAVPMKWETHGGGDVAIMASGPMAHLFHGVHEQSYIAHVIRFGSCLGKYSSECTSNHNSHQVQFLGRYLNKSAAELALYLQFGILLLFTVLLILLVHRVCTSHKKEASENVVI